MSGTIVASLKPSEVERRFLDFIRIIIEGGWVVGESLEWINILDFLDVMPEIEKSKQTRDFFKQVAFQFDFVQEFKNDFLIFEDED